MTANELEWVKRQRCSCCIHRQKTEGHGVVYCDILFKTVPKSCCCALFCYLPAVKAWLKSNCSDRKIIINPLISVEPMKK